MGAKGEALAREFEARVAEASALLEELSEADWKKTTAAEQWNVGVTAHHIASSYESASQLIKTIATGQVLPHFTRELLDERNAQHAKEFAACTKAETIALHQKEAAVAAAIVRGLSDAELGRTGVVFAGMPPVSAEALVKRILLAHIDSHFRQYPEDRRPLIYEASGRTPTSGRAEKSCEQPATLPTKQGAEVVGDDPRRRSREGRPPRKTNRVIAESATGDQTSGSCTPVSESPDSGKKTGL